MVVPEKGRGAPPIVTFSMSRHRAKQQQPLTQQMVLQGNDVVHLRNPSTTRTAGFKLRSSCTDTVSATPVKGIITPGGVAEVIVVVHNTDKPERLQFICFDETVPQEVFKTVFSVGNAEKEKHDVPSGMLPRPPTSSVLYCRVVPTVQKGECSVVWKRGAIKGRSLIVHNVVQVVEVEGEGDVSFGVIEEGTQCLHTLQPAVHRNGNDSTICSLEFAKAGVLLRIEVSPHPFGGEVAEVTPLASVIRVFLRLRPESVNREEKPKLWQYSAEGWIMNREDHQRQKYCFDAVLPPSTTNADVKAKVDTAAILEQFIAGKNCSILAYGQTNSGKTHTMYGKLCESMPAVQQEVGIIQTTAAELFKKIQNKGLTVSVAFFEIYNELCYDLLQIEPGESDDTQQCKLLPIREVTSGEFSPVGLKEVKVKTLSECLSVLQEGVSNRTVGTSVLNSQSSRSHTVFRIFLGRRVIRSEFNFVDLAGSEAIDDANGTTQQKRETTRINLSLTYLKKVIVDLSKNQMQDEGRKGGFSKRNKLPQASIRSRSCNTSETNGSLRSSSPVSQSSRGASSTSTSSVSGLSSLAVSPPQPQHIVYRNSALTKVLRQSIGGNAFTTLICTASPSPSHHRETKNTILFGVTAKSIKNKIEEKKDVQNGTCKRPEEHAEVQALRTAMTASSKENKELKDEVSALKAELLRAKTLETRPKAVTKAVLSTPTTVEAVLKKNTEMNALSADVHDYLSYGSPVTHIINGEGQTEMLYLSDNSLALCPIDPSTGAPLKKHTTLTVALCDVGSVVLGVHGGRSVRFVAGDVSLDLVCSTSTDKEAWLMVLERLCPTCTISWDMPLVLEGAEGTVLESLSPTEAAFCTAVHILPSDYSLVKRQVLQTGVLHTMADIRDHSAFDLHRTRGCVQFFVEQGWLLEHKMFIASGK